MSALEDRSAPPAGEEIHLPGPTVQPALAALALTMVVLGLTDMLYLTAAGVVLLLAVVARWIGDTRRDIRELPLEH